MGKTKTIKIAAVDPDKLEPIDVPGTRVVNPKNISMSLDYDINSLDLKELEYKLNFEATSDEERALLKARIAELKHK